MLLLHKNDILSSSCCTTLLCLCVKCLGWRNRIRFLPILLQLPAFCCACGHHILTMQHLYTLYLGLDHMHSCSRPPVTLSCVVCACRHLLIDGPSLSALDVFKEEEHPSAMGIGSSKEGASVYGLLQRCVTGMVRCSLVCHACPRMTALYGCRYLQPWLSKFSLWQPCGTAHPSTSVHAHWRPPALQPASCKPHSSHQLPQS